ncbi:MAG: VIT domain-containing protein [Hyphomicrobium sp.]
MSDLKTRQSAADQLRTTLNDKPSPPALHLVLGVLYPASVIVFELVTRWCAQTLFDPLPTHWHTLGVALVPLSNLVLWLALRRSVTIDARWLALASGVGLGVAGFYTLIFLPVLPLAVVGILFYGLGLLPLSPLVSLLSAARLSRSLRAAHPATALGRRIAAGMAGGLALLIALDIPAAATRLGVQWAASTDSAERQRGLSLLRTLGDDDLLLRLCYDAVGRPSGLLSAFVMFGGAGLVGNEQRQVAQSTAEVREIYYRVHGVPFNTRPAPFQSGQWARFADFQWDSDHGAAEVGGRVKGLDLVSSRIDGSVNAADAVAYLEWVVEFRNTSLLDREARVEFALPPGGVVSRATLWVNGEEREGAYAGKGEARAAYQRVAVQQRRDPLLVTTKGADRVLAQAFPVPRNGGTIKFKLGITAPLDLASLNEGRFTLPAILDRNFSLAEDVRHTVWLESASALTATAAGMDATLVEPGLHRLRGTLSDSALARTRQTITARRDSAAPSTVLARLDDGPQVTQSIVSRPRAHPGALMLVVDGSVRMAGLRGALLAALDKIPSGTPVGLILAEDAPHSAPIAPWSDDHRRKVRQLIDDAEFVGGQDNTPALAAALAALEAHPQAALLWVHGPQPIAFRSSAGALAQASQRLTRLPAVWLFAAEPGPNEVLPDLPWAWTARSIPNSGPDNNAPSTDLARFLSAAFEQGEHIDIERSSGDGTAAAGLPAGSDHIARLWARDKVVALMTENAGENRTAAVSLATAHRLVTPVSGVVVLETQQQYAEANLNPVSPGSVPTVPEPEEWALILLACGALLWMRRRQREGEGFASIGRE